MAKKYIFPLGCGVSAMTGGIFKCFYAELAVTPSHESSQEPKKQRFLQEFQGMWNSFSSASEGNSSRNVQGLEYSLYFHCKVVILLTMWFQKSLGSLSAPLVTSYWLARFKLEFAYFPCCLPKPSHWSRLLLWIHLSHSPKMLAKEQ